MDDPLHAFIRGALALADGWERQAGEPWGAESMGPIMFIDCAQELRSLVANVHRTCWDCPGADD